MNKILPTVVAFLLLSSNFYGQTFTSSGSFVAPAGVTLLTVECWGGGGAGGLYNSSSSNGGGGGGGAYRKQANVPVVAGTTYSIIVGTGGAASATASSRDGGFSSVSIGATVVSANGGKGGTNGAPGQGGAGGVAGTYKGGDGADGSNLSHGGGGGGSGGTATAGNTATNAAGATAVTGGGAGGAGSANGDGANGSVPGGGGGGGRSPLFGSPSTGGNGARGQVKITYACPNYGIVNVVGSPICINSNATITVSGSATSLPVGIYRVTYDTTNPAQTGLTAMMTVNSAGSGTFVATGFTIAGSCAVTVKRLESGSSSYDTNYSCGTSLSITSSNFTINPLPGTPSLTANSPVCVVSTGTITVTTPTGLNYSIDGINYSNTSGVFNVPVGGPYTVKAKSSAGCISAASSPISIVASTTNTWNGSKWSKTGNTVPPTINDIVVFDGNYTSTGNISGCSCQINSGKEVTIKSGDMLTITNGLINNGKLTFENNASLIQINDAAVNTGKINYKRISAPMKNLDYSYWSSPVKDQELYILSPKTAAGKIYSYSNGWVREDNTMNPAGKGFIIRVPPLGFWPDQSSSTYAQPIEFIGEPYNGVITIASKGTGLDNLIGNPYPSAIDADEFINANATLIGSGLNFWTHNTAMKLNSGGTAYVYTSDDYATYTLAGGTGTAKAVSGGQKPDGTIGAGQSFFVRSTGSGDFVFNNAMRNTAKVIGTGGNSQFFKMANTKKGVTVEKNRVWLNLTNSGGIFKQLLVGYITGATNEMDNLYDATSQNGNTYADFYSVHESHNLAIQARALPFDTADQVPLGYRTTVEGTFEISIDDADGTFVNQPVFVEDKSTNIIHNLKNGPYSFSTAKGTFDDRLILRYSDKKSSDSSLGNKAFEKAKGVIVSVKNHKIKVNSFDQIIKNVMVYDLKGVLIYEKKQLNTNEFVIPNFNSSNQFLIVMTQLADGEWVTKEVIFR